MDTTDTDTQTFTATVRMVGEFTDDLNDQKSELYKQLEAQLITAVSEFICHQTCTVVYNVMTVNPAVLFVQK